MTWAAVAEAAGTVGLLALGALVFAAALLVLLDH